MTAPTRCPSCSAALAPGASWCSLCHADLRPRLEPVRRSQDVVPGAPASQGSSATALATAVPVGTAHDLLDRHDLDPVVSLTPDGVDVTAYDLEPVDHDDDPPVRGRHSRVDDDEPVAPAPRASGGRHAAGHGSSSRRRHRPAAAAVDAAVLENLDTSDVDALADQMLSRLAVTEKRPRLFDPDDVPGGKPVFIAGAAVGVVVVMIFLFTLFGFILGRH